MILGRDQYNVLDQSQTPRAADRLAAVVDQQLPEDRVRVVVDRRGSHSQRVGDLAVRLPGRQELQCGLLALGQLQGTKRYRQNLAREQQVACVYRPDRREQVRLADVMPDAGVRPGASRIGQEEGILPVCGAHDDLDGRRGTLQCPAGTQGVRLCETRADEGDQGVIPIHLLDSLFQARGLGDRNPCPLERTAQPLTEERRWIYDEYLSCRVSRDANVSTPHTAATP